jgi:mannose-6-phosphate isomerase-like protein (cupin superfamily)
MEKGDGFFVPAGETHQYFNMTDRTTRFIFGVAPSYLPTG